jgi:hypothetical protein
MHLFDAETSGLILLFEKYINPILCGREVALKTLKSNVQKQ